MVKASDSVHIMGILILTRAQVQVAATIVHYVVYTVLTWLHIERCVIKLGLHLIITVGAVGSDPPGHAISISRA